MTRTTPSSPVGLHRVIEPEGVLPQAATKVDATPEIWPDEIRVSVQVLNLDAASFRQLSDKHAGDGDAVRAEVLQIIAERGKMQNPITGSGGMLIGIVDEVGPEATLDVAPGQPITTYSTLIGGPRRPGEADGPEEFHVVLLDNGRSSLLANAEEREVLTCIRCGACLNICPVYRNIGGHTYNTTYQGPIGSVLTPHLRGSDFQHLSQASSLCGACSSVCPVNINLHHHLLHNRRDAAASGNAKVGERAQFRLWRMAMLHPGLYQLGGWIMRRSLRLLYGLGLAGTAFDPMRAWSRKRTPVPLPAKSFRARWKEGLNTEEVGRRQVGNK
jgi:ferredoxin